MEELLTVSAAARQAEVSAATIKNWSDRGWLTTASITSTGVRLFRRRDVEQAKQEREARRR
jgi:DNA-binding transcriptional MerR regulator